MTYKNFEDLPVWRDAIELSARIFVTTEDKAFRFRGDIANQLQRAGLSVSNNIAEGFERGTTHELIQFLYYAKGSAGEVRSICHVLERLNVFGHLRSQISDLKSRSTSVSRQLSAWASSLQESDIAGSRRLTGKSKAAWEQKKRAEAFMARLRKDHEQFITRLTQERMAGRQSVKDGEDQPAAHSPILPS